MMMWLLYATLIALLLTIAAEAASQILTLRRRPLRVVWAGALFLSLVLPAVLPLIPLSRPDETAPVGVGALDPLTVGVADEVAPASAPLISLTSMILVAWLAASALLLLHLAISLLRLVRARRTWRSSTLQEHDVLVSSDVGPAVVGVWRPRIVVPEWFEQLPAHAQRIALAHERQHIAARDPMLLAAAHFVLILLPWNVALWYQRRRLRQCVELDCDSRVLRDGLDAGAYAELLLEVGERVSTGPALIAALAEPRSLLELRIRRLMSRRPKYLILRIGGWSIAAVAAFTVMAFAPRPSYPAPVVDAAEAQIDDTPVPSEPTVSLPAADAPATPTVARADTIWPRLRNSSEVAQLANRRYPPLLRDAGVGGTVSMAVQVDTTGKANRVQVKRSSGHAALDDAAVRIVEAMQFTIGTVNGEVKALWIEVPVNFDPTAKPEVEPRRYESVTRMDDLLAGPVFTPFTQPPSLINQADVAAALQRYYPPLLRDAGISGTIKVWFLIGQDGQVLKTQLRQGSGHAALDDAALKVAELMKFSPATNRDQPVNVWVDMPIVFRSQ